MAVRIHVAPHPDALVALLCDQFAEPVGGLFESEVVAVPSRGIERWLTQRIASGLAERGVTDGICANVDFPSPASVVRQALEAVPELARSVRAWDGAGIVSHLLDVIDARLDEPWMQVLARYLDEDRGGSPDNRLAAATKIGTLFSKYARRRPAMIRAWAEGADVGPGGPAVVGCALAGEAVAELRRPSASAPGGVAARRPEPLRRGEADPGFPADRRLRATSADPLDLQVLAALGELRDIFLYVLHPSPALWRSVAEIEKAPIPSRSADPTTSRVANPLLGAWGRDARELQTVLASQGLGGEVTSVSTTTATLLGHLQRDVHENRPPSLDPAVADRVVGGEDRSLQIHVCHVAAKPKSSATPSSTSSPPTPPWSRGTS